jgi:cell division inhibitor SulA/protein ImuA
LDPLPPGLPTGFAVLDAALPSRGWPAGSVIEVITPAWGIGELRLFLPLMQRLSQQGRHAAWIAPPYVPYAPALFRAGISLAGIVIIQPQHPQQALWSMERLLRTTACGLAVAWPQRLTNPTVRRLQLAAHSGHSLGVLFRRQHTTEPHRHTMLAALSLRLDAVENGLVIEFLKARGGRPRLRVVVEWP